MATHSSVLAWRIPGTGEPVGLPSVGSHRDGHNWGDLVAAAVWAQFLKFEHVFKEFRCYDNTYEDKIIFLYWIYTM